jgi:hypothetical protein
MEGRIGLKPVIEGLIQDGLLDPCTSSLNTTILLVKKTDGSYQLVQDLRSINQIVQAKPQVVLNPYTVLSKIPYNLEWFSVIDLKNIFWSSPLNANSWDIFTFEWEDPPTQDTRNSIGRLSFPRDLLTPLTSLARS